MNLFSELRKRKVFATAAIYVPSAWLTAEIFIFLADRLGAPQWVGDVFAVLFILGFPVALLLSFVFHGGTNFDPAVDAHFHEGTFQVKDTNTFESTFVVYANGEAQPEGRSRLRRSQSE